MTKTPESKKSQLGRTMSEMLATLAIMGLLSIGGLVGYRLAVEMHKENETVDQIVKTVVGARTGTVLRDYGEDAEQSGQPVSIPMKDVISNVDFLPPDPTDNRIYEFKTIANTIVSAEVLSRNTFAVVANNLTFNACRKILNANLEYTLAYADRNGSRVYMGSTPEDKEALCKIIDPLERRPSEVEKFTPDEIAANNYDLLILCFGDDCAKGSGTGSGGCPSDEYQCLDRCCSSPCNAQGYCPNDNGGGGNEVECPEGTVYLENGPAGSGCYANALLCAKWASQEQMHNGHIVIVHVCQDPETTAAPETTSQPETTGDIVSSLFLGDNGDDDLTCGRRAGICGGACPPEKTCISDFYNQGCLCCRPGEIAVIPRPKDPSDPDYPWWLER